MGSAAETVRSSYQAFNDGDISAWLAHWHADGELHDLPSMPEGTVYRGREELRAWSESMREAAGPEGLRFEPEAITDRAGVVLARVRASAEGGTSGVPVEMTVFHVFELDGGLIRVGRGFVSDEEARQAAGLVD
jgi:ketosteroid isomerase-like protein